MKNPIAKIRSLFCGTLLLGAVFSAPLWVQDAVPAEPLPDVSAANPTPESEPVIEPAAPEGSDADLQFRNLDEQKADTKLSDAYQILNTTMDVIDFRDEELQDVLRLIAAKSRLNIIMQPEGVQGKVTLHLENVKLGVALEHILKSNNLAYVVSPEENIVRIVDAASVGLQKVETRTEVIQLNWVDAVKLAKTMAELFGDEAKMVPNQDTNALIVTSTPPNLQTIRELVAKADVAERQVLIEARLVDLTVGAQKALGSDISMWQPDKSGLSPRSVVNTTVNTTIDDTGKVSYDTASYNQAVDIISSAFPIVTGGQGLDWAFGKVVSIFGEDFNLSARLQALQSKDMVEILANPRVVTLNNIPAKISIIQRIPYTESVTGVSGATTLEVEFEDSGVEINVTPIITANGFVRMSLETSQKIFRGRVGSGSLNPPLIDHRDANTNVIVKGGETVMIGGLRELRMAEGSNSVPWFGEIPILGWLFKNKTNDQSKTELVLFVTPSIIEQTKLTKAEERWYGRIDDKWHLPDYFFDDVKMENLQK